MERERRIKALSIVALAIAVVGLSIAFAALSSTLNINGTAYLDAAKWGIKFENLSEPTKVGDATVIGNAVINKDVSIDGIDINVKTPGDSVTYTVDLVNDGTIDAKIEKIEKTALTASQQKYLSFTVKYKNGNEVAEGDTLSAGERKELEIKLNYNRDIVAADLPTSVQNLNLSYKLNFVQLMDKNQTTSGTGSDTSKYGKEVNKWQLSDTVNMTYYESDSTAQNSSNSVKMMSNDTTQTHQGGTLVISGTGDMPYADSNGSDLSDPSVLTISKLADINWENLSVNKYYYNPSKVVIESGVTGIGLYDFSFLQFNSLEIASTVKKIGAGAFMLCQNITNIVIPEGVETIGEGVFSTGEHISNTITSISLPSTLTSIGFQSFNSLDNVTTIKSAMKDFGEFAQWPGEKVNTLYLAKTTENVPTDLVKGTNGSAKYPNLKTIYCETENVKSLLSNVPDIDKVNIIVDKSKF